MRRRIAAVQGEVDMVSLLPRRRLLTLRGRGRLLVTGHTIKVRLLTRRGTQLGVIHSLGVRRRL